jgi:ubiquinone/menaquinone biosynthesis C-methylase UbiE
MSISTSREPPSIAAAYDRAARWYDAWRWQRFWDENEVPLVVREWARFHGRSRALDAGAGTGRYVAALSSAGFEVVGADVSGAMLEVAAAKVPPAARLIQADVCDLPLATASFDVAIAARVLGHVSDVQTALAELARVVRGGGSLIVSELDPDHAFSCTSIPTPDGEIHVPVAKRSLETLTRVAGSTGWRISRSVRLAARDCAWLPPLGQLTSIDRSGARAIFYVATFVRE